MSAAIIKATLIACCLTSVSNILAQLITSYRTNSEYAISLRPIIQFVIFVILTCPPNYIWQQFIESLLPSQTLQPAPPSKTLPQHNDEKPKTPPLTYQLSARNVLIKLVIDQTLCAGVNTLIFSYGMAILKGASNGAATAAARREFWGLLWAGWRLWPLVSGFNYALVKTVATRTLIGNLAGVVWGVYLSMVAAR